ncbi:CHAT domain-containing protein [Spongisporangium articulatum]|uniref:CHAT domain-containing protein n=1 Tax=Spongisporangium articulatum TaxID=3362603 RepID=A0ABW8ANN8_9ACTN
MISTTIDTSVTADLAAAHDVLHTAEADPARAVAPATQLARAAVAAGEYAVASIATRALGVAALHLQNTDEAVRHLRVAAGHGRRAGSPELEAEARLRLAAVLSTRGRAAAALRETDAALGGLEGVQKARAYAQKGAVLVQLVRLDAAVENLELAVSGLRLAGDLMWLKRALANRGIASARRLRFDDALADFTEALQINRDLGLELPAAFLEQNLGWAHGLRGHVPLALEHLDRAEATMRRLGAQLGFLLEDRAGLLLSVGLLGEARAVAGEAVAALRRERQFVAVPDVRLLLARLALFEGDPVDARTQARRALAELRRLGRTETASLARFLALAADHLDPSSGPVSVARVRAVAAELDDAGWRADATAARLLAAELATRRGRSPEADLSAAAAARGAGPAATRALGWQAEAQLRAWQGRRSAAFAALTAGLRLLDEGRAGLGADDLRAHSGRQRLALADTGLRLAVESGRAETILTWAEHGRASHLLLPALLPPEDPEFGAELADLRAAAGEVAQARAGGGDVEAAMRHQVAVERRIRDRARRRPGVLGPVSKPVALQDLTDRLGHASLVEYVELDGRLYALVVVAGQPGWRDLGPLAPVRDLVERLPFALSRLARGSGSPESARALLTHTARALDAALVAPLGLGDRPLVVVPTGPLQSLPWSVLPSMRGRAVTVAPSATAWHAAVSASPRSSGGRVVVISGPGLPGARDEAAAVAALHGTTATAPGVEAALGALAGADVAHLATHGVVHRANPLFSSLVLADGPLTGYDLERLRPMPRLVVLAGCDTGRLAVRAGDELLGLVATLLARGARQVVASVVPVPDAETAPLMRAFHAELVAGVSAAQALSRAQSALQDDGHPAAAVAAAAGFVCIGA